MDKKFSSKDVQELIDSTSDLLGSCELCMDDMEEQTIVFINRVSRALAVLKGEL